jgi:hypothetical protein
MRVRADAVAELMKLLLDRRRHEFLSQTQEALKRERNTRPLTKA